MRLHIAVECISSKGDEISKACIIPLLSGGMDSAVSTWKYISEGGHKRVEPIFIDRGQTALEEEVSASRKISEYLGIQSPIIYEVEFPWYKRQKEVDPEAFPYARNLVFLSLATAHAATRSRGNQNIIVTGFVKGDVADASAAFLKNFNLAIEEAIEGNTENQIVKVVAPFIEQDKSELLKYAEGRGGIDLVSLSWSCYNRAEEHGGKHCGCCAGCVNRNLAFSLNGLKDPTEYHRAGF